jgi:hypothetical protein
MHAALNEIFESPPRHFSLARRNWNRRGSADFAAAVISSCENSSQSAGDDREARAHVAALRPSGVMEASPRIKVAAVEAAWASGCGVAILVVGPTPQPATRWPCLWMLTTKADILSASGQLKTVRLSCSTSKTQISDCLFTDLPFAPAS